MAEPCLDPRKPSETPEQELERLREENRIWRGLWLDTLVRSGKGLSPSQIRRDLPDAAKRIGCTPNALARLTRPVVLEAIESAYEHVLEPEVDEAELDIEAP